MPRTEQISEGDSINIAAAVRADAATASDINTDFFFFFLLMS